MEFALGDAYDPNNYPLKPKGKLIAFPIVKVRNKVSFDPGYLTTLPLHGVDLNEDSLAELNIRQLKVLAASFKIYRYSYMTRDELTCAILDVVKDFV